MGTIFSALFFALTFVVCLYIGRMLGLCYRLFLYFFLASVLFFDISCFSESISLFDAGIIGVFSFSAIFAIYVLSSLLCHWTVCTGIDVFLLLSLVVPVILKESLGIEWFGYDVLMAVFQTDLKEAYLFIQDNLSWFYVLLLLVLIFGISCIDYVCRNVNVNFFKRCFLFSFSVIALILIAAISSMKCSGLHYSYMVYENYLGKTRYLKRNENVDYDIFSKSKFDSLTCVIVVGESLCRDYMSAYGYNVQTTPLIDDMLRKNELLRFENVYACDIFTMICLPRMLTSENSYCDNMDYTMVDLLKSNGYRCSWISNQNRGGFDNNAISVLAENCDRKLFDDEVNGYDEHLLPYVKGAICEDFARKLIIVHLVGNHEPAMHHYPQKLPFLRDISYSDETLYHYENSIIYNDSIISEIVKLLPECNSVLFYASDHGSKPGVTRLYDRFDFNMARIPLLIHFSENLKSSHQYINLQEHTDSFWSNDLLFNLVCGVLDIHNPEILAPKYDLSSEEYGLTKEDIILCNGRFNINAQRK